MSIPEKLKSSIFQHISPLAKRIVIYTVLASSFITLFTSTLQLFQVYKSHVTGIELRLNEIRYSYGENIASRVWITNVKELDLALQGILRLPDIEYIEVYEYDELLTKQGQVPDSDTITDNFPLYYTFRNKQEKIGRIFIVASLTRTYQEIIDQALVILFSNAFKTFLISGFMAFIFYHLVARHLITLSRFAGTLDASSLDNTLELVRKKHTGKGDEIDLLGNTLTDLQSRLKKPIEQVTSSQSQVKLLLDSTAEAIYGIDTQGSCTFANKACIDILGYQNDSELLGKNMHELIHYKYADGTEYPVTECKIFQSFQQKKGCHIDNEVLWCKDGSNFSAEYWSHPIFKNNICIGAVVTFIDISVRLESEQIIKENEKNLAVTLNSIGDAVITTDSTGTITRMNPVAEKLTGWSFADAQGLSLNKVFSIFDATTYKKIDKPFDNVIQSGNTIYLGSHISLTSKTGTQYQITNSAAAIRDGNKILGMVLVFSNISEQYQLRESEEKSRRNLQAIMDHSPAIIYLKDLNGHFLFINKQFEQVFDIKRKLLLSKTDFDLFPSQLAEQYQRNDDAVITKKYAIEQQEIITRDGVSRTYSSIKFPLMNNKNEIYAVGNISTDITLRKNQELQLRHSHKMDALGKLTGGIAHDYNNILAIILGYTEQINNNLDHPDKLSKYSQHISHAAERGSRLAKKLLAFSSHKHAELSVININKILHEQQHMLKKTLTARINISYSLNSDLWQIKIDSDDFEDAIINLSINALHAMPSGGQLTISTNNENLNDSDAQFLDLKKGEYVVLSISDTGTGMDEKTKENIFDPFYTTKGEQGTGLGLSQVYGFVERSGGVIKVYSEPGLGSRFVLYLPRSVDKITISRNVTIEPLLTLNGSETILIVDDEPAMLDLAKDIFTKHGYRIFTAENGQQALRILKNETIALIISDVIMPVMDGYELAVQVAQHYPEIKLQMVSGFTDERHSGKVDSNLQKNMLYKPYTSNLLLSKVRDLLNETSTPMNLTNCTVLVLDDDDDVLELFKIKLEKLACHVFTIDNANDTIKQYKSAFSTDSPIDVMIVDLSIPGSIDGNEVASTIRLFNPDAKIIVSSGNSMAPEMTDPTQYGFDAALEKNFDIDNIKKVLKQVLNSK